MIEFEVSFYHEASDEECIAQAKRELQQLINEGKASVELADTDEQPDGTIRYYLVRFEL